MATQQRIVRIRREYNQWVANQTLEDYALRFTAKSARKWSAARVANTALGGISFLALEAIGGTITMSYGFANAVVAILLVGLLIFVTGLPISYYAARDGVDIDLLTRGAGFGYIGSTITSLIYASFTFIFFAIETAILASVLHASLGIPPPIGYLICAVIIIPLVTHGITLISRIQLWSQPVWLVLQIMPFVVIGLTATDAFGDWTHFTGPGSPVDPGAGGSFQPLLCAAAAAVVFSLMAQIGEQVDYLRFLPSPKPGQRNVGWWAAMIAGGPGWIVIGTLKLLGGSFLACLAVSNGLAPVDAAQPVIMYQVAFGYVVRSPLAALALTSCFVIVSQVKINITNAYAGSIAWSNFFSRLTHSHPGRVVWLIFNIAIALLLMEWGIYQAIEHTLVIYSVIAAAWVGALVADLVVNKPLGFSPAYIEFKRAHLYDINPVGTGSMLLAVVLALIAYSGGFGITAQALSPFLAFVVAFTSAPVIAWATRGRFYIARKPRAQWTKHRTLSCVICQNDFEPEDMAYCPAYTGAICSLCCSLDARCHDSCKPSARISTQVAALLPRPVRDAVAHPLGRYFCMLILCTVVVGTILLVIYGQTEKGAPADRLAMGRAFLQAFLILIPAAAVLAWLLVLAQQSRRVAQEETRRQTALLMDEIRAHERTDRALQRAKEAAEAANLAKSRFVVGISHELRSPLNAILGYAQLLERDTTISALRRDHIQIIRRSGEHLAGLIEGLLDVSKIEAGRIELYRDEVRFPEFLQQLVNMFSLQAEAKGIGFSFSRPDRMPEVVYTDERRLRQILINLLSNAIKFTSQGEVQLCLSWRNGIAVFDIIDTGIGIAEADLSRIFEPFERVAGARAPLTPGIGLGLTITRLLTQIMGGELTVTSELNQGSRFRVRLMLSEASQPLNPAPLETRVFGYKGDRLTVLIADDDPVHRGLMEDLLSPLGFIIFKAADGDECLALAATCQPDVLLVDVAMPGPSGWEVARRLRGEGFDKLVIIVISANLAELRRPPSVEQFHNDVLAKPVRIADLLNKLSFLLELKWLAQGPEPAIEPHTRIPSTLDADQIEELRQLGAIGYIRGIQSRLDTIQQNAAPGDAYVAQLRRLISEFQLDAFMEALGPEANSE